MASIHKELIIEVDTERVWSILRDMAYVDRLFAGVLTGAHLDGDVRTVTFANGLVVRKRIIGIDDARRRFIYAVQDEPFQHHSASMQVMPEGAGRCRFIWISDFLPNSLVEMVSPLVDEGARVMKQNLESGFNPTTLTPKLDGHRSHRTDGAGQHPTAEPFPLWPSAGCADLTREAIN
jgi:hypothetical protein